MGTIRQVMRQFFLASFRANYRVKVASCFLEELACNKIITKKNVALARRLMTKRRGDYTRSCVACRC